MQAKDIPDAPILRFLASLGDRLGNWSDQVGAEWYSRSVRNAMPPNVPGKVALAKMHALIRRGLVNGCFCGCRGDFTLTDAGRELLRAGDPQQEGSKR